MRRVYMQRTISEKSLLGLVLFIGAGNFFSIWLGWYVTIWWADVALHTLGGMWSSMFFFYVFERYVPSFSMPASRIASVLIVVGFVMVVGVGWEWFEYTFDHFFAQERAAWRAQRGLPDTMGDLLADFVGGAGMGLYLIHTRGLSKQIQA